MEFIRNNTQRPFTNQRNIMLLGNTGVGKSYFGSALLGAQKPDHGKFETGGTAASVTQKIRKGFQNISKISCIILYRLSHKKAKRESSRRGGRENIYTFCHWLGVFKCIFSVFIENFCSTTNSYIELIIICLKP